MKGRYHIIFAVSVFIRNEFWFVLDFKKGTVKTVGANTWPTIWLVDAMMHFLFFMEVIF